MVCLGGWKALRQPQHGSRRRGDHLRYSCSNGRFEHIVRTAGEHFERQPGLTCALGNANCCLVEDDVDSLEKLLQQRSVPDVSVYDRDGGRVSSLPQVVATSANEIVESHDFARLFERYEIGDVGTNEARATRDQNPFVFQTNHCLITQPSSPLFYVTRSIAVYERHVILSKEIERWLPDR